MNNTDVTLAGRTRRRRHRRRRKHASLRLRTFLSRCVIYIVITNAAARNLSSRRSRRSRIIKPVKF